MAITNFSELKSSVLNDLLRSTDTDADARFVDWLAKFEAHARRRLTGANLGELVASNATIANEFTALPADCISIRSAAIYVGGIYRGLSATSNERIDDEFGGLTGDPRVYAIVGSSLRLGPPPAGTYTVRLTYTALAPLTALAPTNWLLTSSPDVYETGCLHQAYRYYKDFDQADRLFAELEAGLAGLVRSSKAHLPASGLAPRIVGTVV
jgi:hypothetical protein